MRFFTLIDFQHVVLAFSLGLIGAVVIYITFRYCTDVRLPEVDDPTRPPKVEKENIIPPVLVFVYAGVVICIALYVVFYIVSGANAF